MRNHLRHQGGQVIVLGNQRSGTTAIAALLAKVSDRSVLLDVAGIYQVHAGELTLESFIRKHRREFSRAILKEPCLTFLFDDLIRVYPTARYLAVFRDPRDNIRSILNRLKISGNLDRIHMADYPEVKSGWEYVINGEWLGLKGETFIEQLAARWNYAVDVYLKNDSKAMEPIRYEDFMADKVGTIIHLTETLGLKMVNDISDHVDIQYQPRGDKNVTWLEFFGKENLERIEHICSKRMREFNYQPSIGENSE